MDAPFHAIDDGIRRGRAGRETERADPDQPLGPDVALVLDVMDAGTVVRAGPDQLTRVVAGRAADDHHGITPRRQSDGGPLAQLGRLADGIH